MCPIVELCVLVLHEWALTHLQFDGERKWRNDFQDEAMTVGRLAGCSGIVSVSSYSRGEESARVGTGDSDSLPTNLLISHEVVKQKADFAIRPWSQR